MREDIHSFAKIGIVLGMAYPESNSSEEAFYSALKKILVDDYFELVEIGKLPFPALNSVVPDLIRSAHMDFTYCAHGRLFQNRLNPNSIVEEERQRAVEELKRGVDECAAFGASEFQFLSRGYLEDKIPEAIEALVKSTNELCAYAAAKGISVALEIFDYDIDKKSLLGPVDRVVTFYNKVKESSPNFGFMVDCSHIPMIHETLEENLDPIRGAILHAHMGNTYIKDSSDQAYGDLHPRFGYPGSENDTDYLRAFLQKLKDFGYLHEGGENCLSFEIRPVGDEDPDLVVANAKRTLNKAWRLVQ